MRIPLSNKSLWNPRYYKFEKQSLSLKSLGNTGVQNGGEDELWAVQDPVESGRPRSGLRAIRAARTHLSLLQPPEGPGILQLQITFKLIKVVWNRAFFPSQCWVKPRNLGQFFLRDSVHPWWSLSSFSTPLILIKLSFGPAGQAWPSVRGHGERQQRQHRPWETHEELPGETGFHGWGRSGSIWWDQRATRF